MMTLKGRRHPQRTIFRTAPMDGRGRAIVEYLYGLHDHRHHGWSLGISTAKRVHDIGRVPLYGPEQFLAELIPAAAYGNRIPTTGDLAQSDDLRKQLRGLYQ